MRDYEEVSEQASISTTPTSDRMSEGTNGGSVAATQDLRSSLMSRFRSVENDTLETNVQASLQRKAVLREIYGLRYSNHGHSSYHSAHGVVSETEEVGFAKEDAEGAEEEDEEFTMGDPIHDNEQGLLNMYRNKAGAFVNCDMIQNFLTVAIVLNALILGALTFLYDQPKATHVLESIDLVLLVIFSLEVSLQGFYLGKELWQHGWVVFDLVVISFSWIFVDSSLSVMRSFRIFRVFTIIPRWGALRRLVSAIMRTLPNMLTIWVSLGLFFYTFCVLYTDLYHDLYDEGYLDYDYFGRMDRTFLTLFQFMTLDSWVSACF